ncbi:calmodulin [Striga asiatica]|uniref:Calmodulin n=1 Tax=Striga asiatica TaxID=4170 RepID=A0A5A7RJY2_STRAF|nr:calmodulin [Striga asiatica]
MLESTKPCFTSQFNRAKSLLRKLNLLKNCKSTNLSSYFQAIESLTNPKQLFNLIDTNGDGKISTADLKRVFLTLGHDKKRASKEAELMMNEMDFNGDGFVDLDEFVAVVVKNEQDSENRGIFKESDEIMEVFRVFDVNGDGLISAEELHRVLVRVRCGKCSVKECKKMIKGVDRDGDGFVSFEEFKFMMVSGGS